MLYGKVISYIVHMYNAMFSVSVFLSRYKKIDLEKFEWQFNLFVIMNTSNLSVTK